ncbi:hypothetical protein BpHYR1_006729 [Brachionus plicatilis]|uniref:Uncharacterized protein n=1 Tax=Brachionus plicatilis TaxID=10195 RepID=A0A3M7PJ78_BRAPC|nr:hypothetical protein BpHYR1_006729 [Brachionus plicatilis]
MNRLPSEMANEPEESPKTIKEYLAPDLKIEKINEKLISFIIANNLPFNIVNSEEFQELLDTIKSHYYQLPCRQTLKYKLLPEMFLFYLKSKKRKFIKFNELLNEKFFVSPFKTYRKAVVQNSFIYQELNFILEILYDNLEYILKFAVDAVMTNTLHSLFKRK